MFVILSESEEPFPKKTSVVQKDSSALPQNDKATQDVNEHRKFLSIVFL
jgi:hypothetical protein